MARNFDDSATPDEYLEYGSNPFGTAEPISFACWFNSDDLTARQGLVGITYSAGSRGWALQLAGDVAGDPVRISSSGFLGITAFADTTTGYSANTWHSAVGVCASDTSRYVYIDGGSKGSNTTNNATGALHDRLNIGGGWWASAISFKMSGSIERAAIWSAALTDQDALDFHNGQHPRFIQPSNLFAFWDLLGRNSPEPDGMRNYNMTLNGTPTGANGPGGIILPNRPQLIGVGA